MHFKSIRIVAWFTAQDSANVAAVKGTSSAINVTKTATLDALEMRLTVGWGALPNVDLTCGAAQPADGESVAQEVGRSYVIDGNGNVKLNASDASLTKVQTSSVTLPAGKGTALAPLIETKIANTGVDADDWRLATDVEVGLLTVGKVVSVSITASGQLRVCADQALVNGAVGASATYTGQAIELGTATVATNSNGALTWTYDSILDTNEGDPDGGLNFKYSASPKSYDDDSEYAYNQDGATAEQKSYGTLAVSLTA